MIPGLNSPCRDKSDQTRGHNIWFQRPIRKNIPQLSPNVHFYLQLCFSSHLLLNLEYYNESIELNVANDNVDPKIKSSVSQECSQ